MTLKIPVGALTTAALTSFLLITASGVGGQELSWSSSLETGGDDLNLVYSQVSLTAEGLGWKPTATLAAYWVGTDGSDTYALTPQVGLRYRTDIGFFQAKVGYSFKNDDAVEFFGGSEDGVVTDAHGEYWGDGTWGLQGIASYNWGSEYLWSRARALRRIANVGDGGGVSLGGEVVWQGDLGEDETIVNGGVVDAGDSRALQIGPVLQWVSGGPSIWAVSGGWKENKFGDVTDSTWYLKLEFTLSN